mmetsp:Transcript_26491/g.76454  ORF Transcript_26491/g.76454 Transcript_26491/m.76454 type:complete len:297 (+) Transcript_26491:91-981(+)
MLPLSAVASSPIASFAHIHRNRHHHRQHHHRQPLPTAHLPVMMTVGGDTLLSRQPQGALSLLPPVLSSIQLPPTPLLCLYSAILFLVTAATWLYLRLYHPILHPYPWRLASSPSRRKADKKRKVVLAGSYNPPHRGHVAMLSYLSQRYGEVIAVVGMNPAKKYAVTPQQRAEFIQRMIDAEDDIKDNVRVEVVQGYIWRHAFREGVSIMFRGIRSWAKDGDEERYLHFLNTWGPMVFGPLRWPLPTQFLEGKPEFNHISSTLIRNMCLEAKNKGTEADLSALVPEEVADGVAKAYC